MATKLSEDRQVLSSTWLNYVDEAEENTNILVRALTRAVSHTVITI